MTPRILVVDDEALIALDMEAVLRAGELGAEVAVAGDVAGALAEIADLNVVCAVLDADLGGECGGDVAARLRADGIPFVVTSGFNARQLAWLGDAPLISKPVDPARLVATVRQLIGCGQR